MFDRVGVIEASHAKSGVDCEDAAIEAGAQDVEALDGSEVEIIAKLSQTRKLVIITIYVPRE